MCDNVCIVVAVAGVDSKSNLKVEPTKCYFQGRSQLKLLEEKGERNRKKMINDLNSSKGVLGG